MKRFLVLTILIANLAPSAAFAKIDLSGPMSPPSVNLPDNPTDLLDKAVNSLPKNEEELNAVGSKIKESFSTETGQKVRAVLKDIGKAFVWATELMLRWIKILLNKL